VHFRLPRRCQSKLGFTVGERWDDDAISGCFPLGTHGYVNTFGWEFRYDGARARYAARPLRTNNLHAYVDPKGGWSDYDADPGSAGNGDEIYADFRVNAPAPPSMLSRYEPGIGRMTGWPSPVGSYYHTDQLGTIRGVTNSSSAWTEPMAFTAFGERIIGSQNSYETRYGYVGSFGYQAHAEFPFLHVGARYYDPAIGRFLQRDPIGIRGGLNVYTYVQNNPMLGVDPSGLWWWESDSSVSEWLACNFWMKIHSPETLANMSGSRATAEAVGISVIGGVVIYVGGKIIIIGVIRPVGPYPVGPEPVTGPEVPRPIWPKDPVPPVKPSKPIEPGPPYYDPNEPWPSG